jgi:hypothetical protein
VSKQRERSNEYSEFSSRVSDAERGR